MKKNNRANFVTGINIKSVPILSVTIITSLILFCNQLSAQNTGNCYSQLYFGPNAMPIPDMLDGIISKQLNAELTFDIHHGFFGDITKTINAKINVPLFSPRVNLSLWMPIIEFYRNTDASIKWQNPQEPKIKGYEFGNLYISTDFQLMKQSHIKPDITLRAAMITATGDSEEHARFFDTPGYFFDASISKSVKFDYLFLKEFRLIINGGFLCWQTDKSVQNDACIYGIKMKLSTKVFDISLTWQGYSGWQNNGDCPMTIKTKIFFNTGQICPILVYEHGVRDYPFRHFGAGICYRGL